MSNPPPDLPSRCGPEKPCFGQFVPEGPRPLMAMIEVTNRCNMVCPICFSDANAHSDDVPMTEIRDRLERLQEVAGMAIPVQISGGEPTLRDDLADIVALAYSLGFRNIELVTNGIKVSQDPTLLPKLQRAGLTAVYLQFDGLQKNTYLRIRGQDMSEVRNAAVEAVRRAGLCCTLAVAVVRGVNDGEVGDVVRFGLSNIDTVRAINFQSAARFTGRFGSGEQEGGYSLPDLLGLVEAQTGVPADTFRGEHLGHPLCNAMSMVFLVNGRLEPLFKYISSAEMLAFLGEDGRSKVLDLFAGKEAFFLRHLCRPAAWKLVSNMAPIFGGNPFNMLRTPHLLLFAKAFMERDTLCPERVKRCCYGISTGQGVISLCAFNNLYRFPDRTKARTVLSDPNCRDV